MLEATVMNRLFVEYREDTNDHVVVKTHDRKWIDPRFLEWIQEDLSSGNVNSFCDFGLDSNT